MISLPFASLNDISGLNYGITTRAGGVSNGPYGSLNLGFHVGDDPEAVRENRRRVAQKLNFGSARLIAAQQVHGNSIGVVSETDVGRGALDGESAIRGVDGLVTSQAHVPMLVMVADCAPIVLADSRRRVLAVVHAGWRGALAGIAGNAVRVMQEQFGCDPLNIRGGIGPCLSVENLEVGEEVAAAVAPVRPAAVVRREDWLKPHLDLRALILADLQHAGVSPKTIEVSPLCPQNENALLFSHRGQKGVAGRFGVVAWWG